MLLAAFRLPDGTIKTTGFSHDLNAPLRRAPENLTSSGAEGVRFGCNLLLAPAVFVARCSSRWQWRD